MILNDSYNHKEVNRQINESVGTPFSLMERIKMRGNGSPRCLIEECSLPILQKLELDSNANWCYIELRPKGLIIRFRSLLETWAWVIPWWKLALFKTNPDVFSFHSGENFIRIQTNTKPIKKFVQRVMELKAQGI